MVTGRFRIADFGPSLPSELVNAHTIVVSNIESAIEFSESEREGYASL